MSLSCDVVAGAFGVKNGFQMQGVLTFGLEMVGFEHQVGGCRKTLNDGDREVGGSP